MKPTAEDLIKNCKANNKCDLDNAICRCCLIFDLSFSLDWPVAQVQAEIDRKMGEVKL